MKRNNNKIAIGRLLLTLCMLSFAQVLPLQAAITLEIPKASQQYYELRVYHLKSAEQKKVVEDYLRTAAIPALNKLGISPIGVFDKPDQKDGLQLYVFIPYKSLEQFTQTPAKLLADATYQTAAAPYLNAVHTEPAYERIESTLMKAFKDMPALKVPTTTVPKKQRVYEYRSYESFSEKSGLKKIEMFNEGGEIKIFDKLGFNAVFYAQAITGSQLPNLAYMTTFDSQESKDQHWAAFGNDPDWKRISALPEYQNTVSKAHIHLLTPTDYSQI
ncbi:MAG: NIPSNAP family protein [Bacteroidota bacterium]